jgi:hypothetical protein
MGRPCVERILPVDYAMPPPNNVSGLPQVSDRLAKNAMRHVSERLIETVLFAAAAVSVLTTVGIVYVLVTESIHFFQNVPIIDFLTDTQWTPLFDDAHYGIMVLISGTLVSSGVALAVAIPMGPSSRSTCPNLPIRKCVKSPSRCSSCSAASRPSFSVISHC